MFSFTVHQLGCGWFCSSRRIVVFCFVFVWGGLLVLVTHTYPVTDSHTQNRCVESRSELVRIKVVVIIPIVWVNPISSFGTLSTYQVWTLSRIGCRVGNPMWRRFNRGVDLCELQQWRNFKTLGFCSFLGTFASISGDIVGGKLHCVMKNVLNVRHLLAVRQSVQLGFLLRQLENNFSLSPNCSC